MRRSRSGLGARLGCWCVMLDWCCVALRMRWVGIWLRLFLVGIILRPALGLSSRFCRCPVGLRLRPWYTGAGSIVCFRRGSIRLYLELGYGRFVTSSERRMNRRLLLNLNLLTVVLEVDC